MLKSVFGEGFFNEPGSAYKNGQLNGIQMGGDEESQSLAVVMHKDLKG